MATAIADPMTTTLHRALISRAAFPLSNPWSAAERHRAVMALFPDTLPGPKGQRRAASNILFRFEETPTLGQAVMVQATTPLRIPEHVSAPQFATHQVTVDQITPQTGSLVTFRLAAHTVRRNGKSERPLSAGDVDTWVRERLAGALRDIVTYGLDRTVLVSPERTGKGKQGRIQIDVIDGVGVVEDDTALQRLIINGVGRAKAYGAGLLTVTSV